jgi:hypothetical protein
MPVNPETTARKLISLPHALVRAIDDYRFANRIKTESEAIRRLIEAGLKAGDPIKNRKLEPPSSGGSEVEGGGEPKTGAKPPPVSRQPKAAPTTKEAQIRAMREQTAR